MSPLSRASAVVCFLLMMVTACGDNQPAPTTPTSPTTPTPPTSPGANAVPQIVRTLVTPAIGVKDLTTFTAHVDAQDADGDRLTYAWSTPTHPTLGSNAPDFVFTAGSDGTQPMYGSGELSVTVADGKNPAVSQKLEYLTVDLDGTLDGYFDQDMETGGSFTMILKRSGGMVTGRLTIYDKGGVHNGLIDPAEPGQVDASGHFHLRFKVDAADDLVLDGQFVADPRPRFLSNWVGTGRARGGGHEGVAFTFGYHDPY